MPELLHTPFVSSILGYWRMENSAVDETGANNGTATAVTFGNTDGRFGSGANFNGTTSKIVLSDIASQKPTGHYTANFWLKINSVSYMGLFQSWAFATNIAGWRTGVNNGLLFFDHGKNTGSVAGTDYVHVGGAVNVNTNTWHMCTFVYDASNLSIYVDGILDQSSACNFNAAYDTTTYIRIGCDDNAGTDGSFSACSLDDVALLSRDLSATEIASLYASANTFGYSKHVMVGSGMSRSESAT